MPIKNIPLGKTPEGQSVDMYQMEAGGRLRASIITYGGIIASLEAPDRDGNMENLSLGFDSFDGYLQDHPYFGALIGRVANRISGARFDLDGKTYELADNDNGNHLHGGLRGFDKIVWDATTEDKGSEVVLRLCYTSCDGEENYPGNLHAIVTYTLNDRDELRIDYEATTDQATPCNLTNHTYWNLSGCKRDVLDHVLEINADRYTPSNAALMPTGEIASVVGTPVDFRQPERIGARIEEAGGYDHNFALNGEAGNIRFAARVTDPESGRVLEVETDQPAIQLYTGNFLDGSLEGPGGVKWHKHYAVCLETQGFPDAVHHDNFPDVILRPGQIYRHATIHRFKTA